MHNKFKKEMLEARKYKNVYIVKKIVKNLNKFVLFLAIRHNFASLININIIFLNINNVFKFAFIDLINVNIDSTNVTNKLAVVNKLIIINL